MFSDQISALVKRRLRSLEVIEHFTLMSFERQDHGGRQKCSHNDTVMSQPDTVRLTIRAPS